jgi:hypothetical protein
MTDPIIAARQARQTASPGTGTAPDLDREAAWKGEFRATMARIREGGFDTLATEIRAEKLEELREKILGTMGLSEEQLQEMPAEQRAAIEKLIAREIQQRLAAECEIEGEGNGRSPEDAAADPGVRNQAVAGGLANGAMMIEIMERVERAAGRTGQEIPSKGNDFPGGDTPEPGEPGDRITDAKTVDRRGDSR